MLAHLPEGGGAARTDTGAWGADAEAHTQNSSPPRQMVMVSSRSSRPVVSPFFPGDATSTGTPGVFAHVEYAGACGSNGVQVDTFRVIPGTTTVSGSTNHTNEGSS